MSLALFYNLTSFFLLSQEIKTRIELEKDPNKDSVIFDLVDNQPQRMQRIRQGLLKLWMVQLKKVLKLFKS
jgi:hypothetical protein